MSVSDGLDMYIVVTILLLLLLGKMSLEHISMDDYASQSVACNHLWASRNATREVVVGEEYDITTYI